MPVGVERNIAKMYEDHAKQLGKTVQQLTQAEKVQAVYNGYMEEAAAFVGSAAEMADGYQGKQAQLNASTLELSRTFGETMIPVLNELTEKGLALTQWLNSLVGQNQEAAAGTVAFVATLGTLAVGLTAIIKIFQTLKTAMDAATASSIALKTSLAAITVIGAVVASNIAEQKVREEGLAKGREELIKTTERYNKIHNDTLEYTLENIEAVKQERDEIKKLQESYKKLENSERKDVLELIQLMEATRKYVGSGKDLNENLKEREEYLKKANAAQIIKKAMDLESVKTQQKEAAELKNNVQQMQTYLDVVKKGDKTTSDYKKAVEELTKAYPEAANAEGVIVDLAQDHINAQKAEADQSWNTSQQLINDNIGVVNQYIKMAQAAENDKVKQQELANQIGISYSNIIPTLNSVLKILQLIGGYKPEDVPGTTPQNYTHPYGTGGGSGGGSSSKTYQNKKLENYKKEIEHKKALDKISLKQEIAMYETALKKYAKTQDEKWELQEKIYDLNKELQEKALDNYTSNIEYKKSLDKLSLQQEINMYKTALKKYAKTTEEKRDLRTKIYELNKELQEKELTDYTSNIEYKKSLDKISLQNEIKMYQTALKKYAKTTEEKKELTVKIYELNKELQEKQLSDYTANIEYKKSLDKLSLQKEIELYETALDKYAKTTEDKKELRIKLYELNKQLAQKEKDLVEEQTEQYLVEMQRKKAIQGAAYDAREQRIDYEKIIIMHKEYLNQIMQDERLSLEERKSIYKEELGIIRDYEQQKRDLRVSQIDNTVSQLTNAIKKQLQELQAEEKAVLDANLEEIEKWKEVRINAINEEYDARIEMINKELEALDKAEQQKTRNEEDAEYEKKKKRLEELVAFEHDATTKANYQKELDKLVADHQKTLDNRRLADTKEALNNQKNLLKEEQNQKVQIVQDEFDSKKAKYEQDLKALEEHYDKQIDMAQETAEKMLLNVQNNQEQILSLLEKYGDAYEITGQSLGEKLAQGMNESLSNKIENVISDIQYKIDRGIGVKIAEMAASLYQYDANAQKSDVKSITTNVVQNNTIVNPVESPATIYKKQETLNRNLANQIAEVF